MQLNDTTSENKNATNKHHEQVNNESPETNPSLVSGGFNGDNNAAKHIAALLQNINFAPEQSEMENATYETMREALLKANKKIRYLEAKYELSLQASEAAAWDWDMETNIVIWNEQHFTLFGLKPTETLEVKVEAFLSQVHPEDVLQVSYLLKRALQSGLFEAKFRIKRKDDNALRWMRGYGRVLEDAENRKTLMTGVMYDITEHMQTKDEL